MSKDPSTVHPPGVPLTFDGAPLTASWAYRNPAGEVIGYVARYNTKVGGKKVRPYFRRNGDSWRPGAPSAPRPIFGLDRIEGVDTYAVDAQAVYVVEGEKCAAALQSLGYFAVSAQGGAASADKSDWNPLDGVPRVYLLPDNDRPGQRHMEAVAANLSRLPSPPEVHRVNFPNLPAKGDVADWISERVPEWDGFAPVPSEHRAQLRAALDAAVAEHAEPWRADAEVSITERDGPIPLRPKMPPVQPFPIDALGPILGPAARALAEVIQAPDAMCGQAVLAAAALAVQAQADVCIDGRRFPTSGFFLSVGESGERKSAVDDWALDPIRVHEMEAQHAAEIDKREYELAREAYERRKKKAIDGEKPGKRSAVKRPIPIKEIMRELGDPPEPPPYPHFIVSDPTLEGIQSTLKDYWPTIGLFTDEGGTVSGGWSMSKDNILRTVSGLADLWGGKSVVSMRRGGGRATLRNRRLSLHLMMQPVVAAKMLEDEVMEGQGFLSRCLIVWPESNIGNRRYAQHDLTRDERMIRYSECLRKVAALPIAYAAGRRLEIETRAMELDPEATEAYIQFHDEVEAQLGSRGRYNAIKGFGSKAAEQAARLAGVLTVLADGPGREINAQAMEQGITLMRFYLEETRRIKTGGRMTEDLRRAELLGQWIREKRIKAVSTRDVCNSGPNPIREKARAEAALKTLEAHGYVERESRSVNPRKSNRWRVIAYVE
ncbi:MAG: DUF3987 domain-containing protein [Candidatus Hydrogenedens sp.]|nr:DUF3987 domain-containing protein [Candidatus Hydrogenedens sp.]